MTTYNEGEPTQEGEIAAWRELMERQRGSEVVALRYVMQSEPKTNPQLELYVISVPGEGALFDGTEESGTRFTGSMAHIYLYPHNPDKNSVGRFFSLPQVVTRPSVHSGRVQKPGQLPQIKSPAAVSELIFLDRYGVVSQLGEIEAEVLDDISRVPYMDEVQLLLKLHLYAEGGGSYVPQGSFTPRTLFQANLYWRHIDGLIVSRVKSKSELVVGRTALASTDQIPEIVVDKVWCRAQGDESLRAEQLFAKMGPEPTVVELLLRAEGGEYDASLLGISAALGMTLNANLTPYERVRREVERYERILTSLRLILTPRNDMVAKTFANQ